MSKPTLQKGTTVRHVLVLGGTSRVWQAMMPYWSAHAVPALKTTIWARRPGPGVDVVCSIETLPAVLPRCDVVVAMWGVTTGAVPDLERNTDLAIAAQDIAAKLGASCVIHAMTGAVYTPSDGMLNELSKTEPRHAYGASKRAAEQAILHRAPRPILLRLGNVAGCDGLAAALTTARSTGRPITLDRFADETSPRRSYVAPDDLAWLIASLALAPPDLATPCLNVAGPQPVGMDALLRAAGLRFDLRPAPPDALPLQHLDVGRLRDIGFVLSRSSDPRHLAAWLTAPEATS